MENFLQQHTQRLTDADAAALAVIETLERERPTLSQSQLLAIVARSPSGRDLASRIGAPLARSVSLPHLEDAAAVARRSAAKRVLGGPSASAPASMTGSALEIGCGHERDSERDGAALWPRGDGK